MNERITMTLSVTVTYDTNGERPMDIAARLRRCGDFLAGEGLLSGDGPAEVVVWYAVVDPYFPSAVLPPRT